MNPWLFLLIGYPVTVAVEAPILLIGLSRRHSPGRRLLAGFWLTACTYPVSVVALPALLYHSPHDRPVYLLVAETFAPVAECVLFAALFCRRAELCRGCFWRDMAVIVLANLASFAAGEALDALGGWHWLFHLLGVGQ